MSFDIPVLRRGCSGHYVRVVQEVLNLWFGTSRKPLVPDGVFGSNTDAAVRAFQEKFHLAPDGIIGPLTHAALFPLATYVLDVHSHQLDSGAGGTVPASVRSGPTPPGNAFGQAAGNPPSPPPPAPKATTKFQPAPPSGPPVKVSPPGPNVPMAAPAPSDKDKKNKEVQLSVGGKLDLPKHTLAGKPSAPNKPNPPKTSVVYSVQGVMKNTPVGDVSVAAQAAEGTVKDSDGKLWSVSVVAKATRSQDLVKLGDWGRLKIFGEAAVKGTTNFSTGNSASASAAAGVGLSIKPGKQDRVTIDIKGTTQLEGTYDKTGVNLHMNNSATGGVTVHF